MGWVEYICPKEIQGCRGMISLASFFVGWYVRCPEKYHGFPEKPVTLQNFKEHINYLNIEEQ